jgi:elongation factor P
MLTTSDFKEGLIFLDNDGNYMEILHYQHHRKSQARAVVRVKLRNLNTGAVVETSYRPEEKFNPVDVSKRPMTYLYSEGDMSNFMDSASYEQVSVADNKLGDVKKYLVENMEVQGLYLNDNFFNIVLEAKVTLTVQRTEPGVRGDSVSNMTKPAILDSGLEIKVPLFINEGDKVRVDTRSATYVERVS